MICHREHINNIVSACFETDGGLPVWKWAEKNLHITDRENPERAGPYSTALVPYVREPLECFRDPAITDVALVWATQTTKTFTMMVGLSWLIHHNPGNVLWVRDTEPNARSFSETRWRPFLESSPVMAGHIPSDTDRYKLLEQHFDSCTLNLVGSNSPGNLASRPAPYVVQDETDKFKEATEKEAAATALADRRAGSFSKPFRLKTSSPTVEWGAIWRAYLSGDQRKWFIPCPHCGEFFVITIDHFKFPKHARRGSNDWDHQVVAKETAVECPKCAGLITDAQRVDVATAGEWRPTNPSAVASSRSYHLPSWYAPWISCRFGAVAVRFLEGKRDFDLHDFDNNDKAEPYKQDFEELKKSVIMDRREVYKQEVPEEVLVLVAGVDTQDDRLECEILGVGKNFETWSIDYGVMEAGGSPDSQKMWDQLSDFLFAPRRLPVEKVMVDTGGHFADKVYEYCYNNSTRGVDACKGANVRGKPAINKPTKQGPKNARVKLYTVGTETIKDGLFARLKISRPGPGFCHFPKREPYNDNYFKMLTAERKRTKLVKGQEVSVYELPKGRRNEALDCRVYALAALHRFPSRPAAELQRRALAKEKAEKKQKPPGRKGSRPRFKNDWR